MHIPCTILHFQEPILTRTSDSAAAERSKTHFHKIAKKLRIDIKITRNNLSPFSLPKSKDQLIKE